MNTSKLLVIIAIGTWLITALTFVVAWGVQWLGVPYVLFVPFMAPTVIADRLGWAIPQGWSTAIACCSGAAWLLAAVELWRRPKTSFALGLCVAWIALVVFGYCSLQQSIRDL
jgi:hypothetical protein